MAQANDAVVPRTVRHQHQLAALVTPLPCLGSFAAQMEVLVRLAHAVMEFTVGLAQVQRELVKPLARLLPQSYHRLRRVLLR